MNDTNEIKFSFVVPLYNESEVFLKLIDRLSSLINQIDGLSEVVLVDDGSSDDTPIKMEKIAVEDKRFQCIFLSRNFGHQKALSAGLEMVRGEYIMVLDGDLQDPPELFFDFYDKIQEGFDVVYGIRIKRKEGFLKKMAYSSFYRILNSVSNYPIPKDSGDFALMTKRVVKAMTVASEESRYLRGLRSWVGFKQTGYIYERQGREEGYPKYTFIKLLKLASDGIFNFTTFPVKLLTMTGIACIFISTMYFIVTVLRKFIYNDVPLGFTALLFIIILFGGIQLFSLGVIGEYIQRIFFQVKQRPLYIISKKIIDGNIKE